jgi:hypothetical protein
MRLKRAVPYADHAAAMPEVVKISALFYGDTDGVSVSPYSFSTDPQT